MDGALDLFAMASALLDEDTEISCNLEDMEDTLENWKNDTKCSIERKFVNDVPCVRNDCHLEWPHWSIEWLVSETGDEMFALYNGAQFTLKEYLNYAADRGLADHKPLYLFEDLSIVESPTKQKLLDRYSPPKCLPEDMFDIVPRNLECRPRFRWLLIGPKGSGTHLHIDPQGTSAWNTLLEGTKRWVFLPPDATPNRDHEMSILEWFANAIPQNAIEYTQHSGETMFVPGGWWHAVLNLDMTLAVTQNWASENHLSDIVRKIQAEKPSPFKQAWLEAIAHRWPSSFSSPTLGSSQESWVSSEDHFWYIVETRYRYIAQLANDRTTIVERAIPKILHCIRLEDDATPQNDFLESWRAKHPAWCVKVWKEEDIREVMQSSINNHVIQCARYQILHEFGGVFVDISVECIQPIDDFVQRVSASDVAFCVGLSGSSSRQICHRVIVAQAGHPLLVQAQEAILAVSSEIQIDADADKNSQEALTCAIKKSIESDQSILVVPPIFFSSPSLMIQSLAKCH